MRDAPLRANGQPLDPNPLTLTWHWGPLDDIGAAAFYEPADGIGIAWSVPRHRIFRPWDGDPNSDPRGQYENAPDYSNAEFKSVEMPEIVEETLGGTPTGNPGYNGNDFQTANGVGWELMRIGTVDAVVYQNLSGGGFPRQPPVATVNRLIYVDQVIRSS